MAVNHTEAPRTGYEARFRAVLRYIDANLDDDLSVERLSAVARSSLFHFHRQFSALFGVSVARYVQLARLFRASGRLAFRESETVLAIAVEHGYESPEAFARAFKRAVGQSPSSFRSAPDWQAWAEAFAQFNQVRSTYMQAVHGSHEVIICAVPATRVALLVHRGPPARIGETIRSFIAFRRANGLSPSVSATYNILYDNPATTAPDAYRFGLAAGLEGPLPDNNLGVVESEIPAGRCAVLDHVGGDGHLFAAVKHLYAEWLPSSGEEVRDFPLYLQRVRFSPAVPEHEAESRIFLPLR